LDCWSVVVGYKAAGPNENYYDYYCTTRTVNCQAASWRTTPARYSQHGMTAHNRQFISITCAWAIATSHKSQHEALTNDQGYMITSQADPLADIILIDQV